MLINLLVGQLRANMKCHTKNIFFLSKKVVSHMTSVNKPIGSPLSLKVKIFYLQWAGPLKVPPGDY